MNKLCGKALGKQSRCIRSVFKKLQEVMSEKGIIHVFFFLSIKNI